MHIQFIIHKYLLLLLVTEKKALNVISQCAVILLTVYCT